MFSTVVTDIILVLAVVVLLLIIIFGFLIVLVIRDLRSMTKQTRRLLENFNVRSLLAMGSILRFILKRVRNGNA